MMGNRIVEVKQMKSQKGKCIMIKTLSMRKKTTAIVVAVAMVIAAFAAPMSASAAPLADSEDTTATVVFSAGNLSLDDAPILDFGTHAISNATEDYPATGTAHPITVTDLRGSNAGWNVTASLSGFTSSSNSTLSGAYITLDDISISAANGTVATPPSVTNASIKLDSGGSAVKVLTAANGTGSGVHDAALNLSKTMLTVLPGTASAGTHQATLHWELNDTP
jgi:hypothetical protein